MLDGCQQLCMRRALAAAELAKAPEVAAKKVEQDAPPPPVSLPAELQFMAVCIVCWVSPVHRNSCMHTVDMNLICRRSRKRRA
jgi:hypothetical protein